MYKLRKENITGISPIIIGNAEEDSMILNIEGDSYQATREGYNLVKASNKFRKGNGGNGIIGSVTTEGYLQVIAEEENENWYNSFWSLDGQESINKIKDILKVGDTFTIAFTIKRTEGTSKAPMVYIKENSSYKTMSGSVTTSFSQVYYTGTWEDGFDLSIIHLGFANLTGTFIIKDWMVKKGNIAEWQEYGVSPSLDSPAEVEAVGDSGNIEITTSNKNILDLRQVSANGITYNKNRITIVNPTNYLYDASLNLINKKFLSGKSLTLTLIATGNVETNNVSVNMGTNKDSYRFQKYFVVGNYDNTKFTITSILQEDEYITYINVYVPTTALPKCNLTIDLQMEINTASDFIEHKGNTYTLPIQKPFHKLGNYADGFARLGNQWYEQHYIKERILTGDEKWFQSSLKNNRFAFKLTDNVITDDSKILAMSNYFVGTSYNQLQQSNLVNVISLNDRNIAIDTDNITDIETFKAKVKELYDSGNPIKVYYILATPELIECTEEQSEILNNLQTYDGQNIIAIDTYNNTQPNISIDYTPKMIDEIKQAFTTNVTKAHIIKTSDGTEINQDNYLKDLKLEELRFIPDNGFLGGTVARRLTMNFNNVDNQFNIQDEDLQLSIGVEYNGKDYYIDYGNFIVQKPETENTTDNTSFEALDYMSKLNQAYNDTITYPCKLVDLAKNVCEQAGLELGNTDFRNADFIVTDNQFVNGETLRVVLGAIALSAFSWARIGQDNKVYIDFKIKQKEDVILDSDKYYNLSMQSKSYGPINRIVLRNSQIEGENVTVEDNESITNNGIHELVIADNPFAYTQEKREQLIEAGKKFYGFSYMPINSMDTIGYLYLDSNSLAKIIDMQGNEIYSYVLNHTIDYDGTSLDNIESPALTETETKYTYTPEEAQKIRRTEAIVNKHEQTINFIIEEQTELGNKQNVLEQTLESTTNTIKEVNDDLTEKINQLQVNLDGVTQTLTQSGGNNIFAYAKEFWTGLTEEDDPNLEEYTDTEIQQESISGLAYKINNGTSIQKVQVKNDTYTISFKYKKLIELATGYVLINGDKYDLTSTNWDEIVVTITVDTNYVDFEVVSDTNNAFEIFDLMGTIGTEKQVWTQNANETRTDTVKIGKGITVSSSQTNTIWKADSDGNRIINTDTNEIVAEFTDKGTKTKNIEVSDTAEISGILIQEIDGQTWISSLL